MLDLTAYRELHVKQEVEQWEIFTPIETRNRYRIVNPDGGTVLYAYEESGFWARQFLRTHRPLTLHFLDPDTGQPVLTASRKFFWFFSHLHIHDSSGRSLGSLQARFSFPARRFTLQQGDGQAGMEIRGRLFRPNTFMLKREGAEIARITKKWGGFLKEAFTRADTFKIEFEVSVPHQDLWLLVLAVAIAIDLDFFENRRGWR